MNGQVGLDSTCARVLVDTPFPDAAPVRPVAESSRADQITVNPSEDALPPRPVAVSPPIDLSIYVHLPRLMTPKQVEEESNLSKPVINRAIQSGALKSIKPTKRARRIPVEWYAEWIAAMKAEAASASP